MAIKGLSIPVIGTYNNVNGTVSYSDPVIASKAAEYSVSWTTGDDNPLYLDNGIAENDKGTFQSGELTLATGDLAQEISARILGTKTVQETFTANGEQVTVDVQVFDDDRNSPYLGFGIIEMHQVNDVTKFRPVFFPKVYFNIPEEAATTKGETIEWQTRSITAQILRSDAVGENGKHPWMMDAWFDTESVAQAWLMYKCGQAQDVAEA